MAGAILVALVLPAGASAAQRFAAATPAGAMDCSSAADACSLQVAIESASNNDEVLVAPGTYDEGANPLVASANDLDIRASGAGTVQINVGSASSGFTINGTNSVLRGVRISYTTGGNSALRLSGEATVRRVFAETNSGVNACRMEGGGVTITDSVCWNRRVAGGGQAVVADGQGNDTLRNVTAVASVGANTGIRAISAPGQTTAIGATNTIALDATGSGFDVAADQSAGGTAEVTISSSNFTTRSGTVTDPATVNNVTGNPNLVDVAAGDFHQTATSPTIDAGDGSLLAGGELDIDGEARIQGFQVDIGADERDVVAPTASITSGPADGSTITTATATFGFSSNEAGAFQCSTDAGAFGACSGPGATHTVTGLANGAHSFTVRAIDVSGNLSAPVTRTFTVAVPSDGGGGGDTGSGGGGGGATDTDPPETTIERTKVKDDDVKVKFRSDEPGSTFECKVDTSAYRSCTSPRKVRNLDDGRHKFLVRATDSAGNTDGSAARSRFEIDD